MNPWNNMPEQTFEERMEEIFRSKPPHKRTDEQKAERAHLLAWDPIPFQEQKGTEPR